MTAQSKEHNAIWAQLFALSNYDEALMEEAQARATNPRTNCICLKTMKRHILRQTNPALLATLEAADDFARAVQFQDRILNLPHLQRIHDLAAQDPALPQKIFAQAAGNWREHRHLPLGVLIEDAINHQTSNLTLH